jgi:hypothetical protein
MFEREVQVSQQMMNVLRAILNDIDEANWARPIEGTKNPPAYIVGHLAATTDSGMMLLGRAGVCPPAWQAAFGPGSSPDKVPFAYPAKAELCDQLERVMAALQSAAKEATPEAMNRPHGVSMFATSPLKTVGDMVGLLLTAHLSFHAGQLSLIRRHLGFAPIF